MAPFYLGQWDHRFNRIKLLVIQQDLRIYAVNENARTKSYIFSWLLFLWHNNQTLTVFAIKVYHQYIGLTISGNKWIHYFLFVAQKDSKARISIGS